METPSFAIKICYIENMIMRREAMGRSGDENIRIRFSVSILMTTESLSSDDVVNVIDGVEYNGQWCAAEGGGSVPLYVGEKIVNDPTDPTDPTEPTKPSASPAILTSLPTRTMSITMR